MKLAQATMYLDQGFTVEQVRETVGLTVNEANAVYRATVISRARRTQKKAAKVVAHLERVISPKRKWRYDNPKFA